MWVYLDVAVTGRLEVMLAAPSTVWLSSTIGGVAAILADIWASWLGQDTAVVGRSRRSSSSATAVWHFLAACERLAREMEKPGAFSDVSNAPERILIGEMCHLDS